MQVCDLEGEHIYPQRRVLSLPACENVVDQREDRVATKGDEPKDSIEPKGHLIRVIRLRIWEWSTRSSNVETSRIHAERF